MRKSITHAARDLEVLGRLAVVPGLIASVLTLLLLIFALLSSTDSRPVVPWFAPAVCIGAVAALALGWCATRVRRGSTLTVASAALTFWLGVLLLALWWGRAGESAIAIVLTASTLVAVALGWFATRVRKASTPTIGLTALTFWVAVTGLVAWWNGDREPAIIVVLTGLAPILAASSWWALRIAHRLHSGFPAYRLRPHATRRLSLPRDARALRVLAPALLGSLQVLATLLTAIALGPLMRQGGLSVGIRLFMPEAYRHFRRVRAVLALRAQEVRLEDRRSPVLLLRSFADDDLSTERTKAFLVNVTKTKRSLEEVIVAQLWEVGPVVAIGQPGLDTDPIGAARERIVGPLWQPRVQALIDESALIAVVLGQTEGLFWEYEQLSSRRVPVLAVLPPRNATFLSEWQRFAAAYPPARSIVMDVASELPLLIWFRTHDEPLIVSGQSRDERSYELAFAVWRQDRVDCISV